MSTLLSWILGILFFPLTLLGSWVVVHPQEEAVVLMWGKVHRLYDEPGLYCCNMWGRKVIKISTKKQAIDIPRSVVADGNGNPIVVAGVVTYHFLDSKKAAAGRSSLRLDPDPIFLVGHAEPGLLRRVNEHVGHSGADHRADRVAEQELTLRILAVLLEKIREALLEQLEYGGSESPKTHRHQGVGLENAPFPVYRLPQQRSLFRGLDPQDLFESDEPAVLIDVAHRPRHAAELRKGRSEPEADQVECRTGRVL